MRSYPKLQDDIKIPGHCNKVQIQGHPVTAHAIEKTIEWRAANAALLQRAKDGLKHPQESKFR